MSMLLGSTQSNVGKTQVIMYGLTAIIKRTPLLSP
jgi:hypothetical protein